MKKVILIFVSVLLTLPLFAETIIFKSGKKIESKIVERTDEYIKVEISGIPITYYLNEIESIDGKRIFSTSDAASSYKHSGAERTPMQIFTDVVDAVVIINAPGAMGHSLGSGFILKENGVVVTNFHVVAQAETIEVKLKNGKTYPVSGIIAYDVARDICVMKIDAVGLKVLSLGDSDRLIPGEKVLVIGSPLGLEYSITEGLYSGKRSQFDQDSLQFSAAISPGNSGGPLFNAKGEVVGITTFTNLQGQNVNFAIPINEAKAFIKTYPVMPFKEFLRKRSGSDILLAEALQVYSTGYTEQALKYLYKIVEQDPNYIPAYDAISEIYFLAEAYDRFEEVAKKILEIDPHNAKILHNLGAAYGKQGEFTKAIEYLKEAIRFSSNEDKTLAQIRSDLAAAYQKINDLDNARRELEIAVSIDPNNTSVRSNLGILYYLQGELDKAITETKKALAILAAQPDPIFQNEKLGRYNYNLSYIYYAAGRFDLAIKHCDEALRLGYGADPDYLEKLRPYR